jgi:chemotaxis protein MotB
MIGTRAIRRRRAAEDDAPEYWVTYADLLVSLLMVFALLLFLTLSKMQRDVADVGKTITANNEAVRVAVTSMGASGSGGGLWFDPKAQALTMNSEVLFAYGSAALRPEAEATIRAVATQFIPALLQNPTTAAQLQEIVVEGHTDTVGTYMSNLDLSQRRAFSVMRAIVEGTYGTPYAERLRSLITASGRSEVEWRQADGSYDAARARRIAIRIRFRNDDLLKRLVGTGARSTQRGQ